MLSLVTVKARTKGKTPVEFTYQGVGKLEERPVRTKDGDKQVDLIVDGKSIIVHDVDAAGITSDMAEVVALFDANPLVDKDGIKVETTSLQRIIDGALNWFNVQNRKAASPSVEIEKEDELTPLVSALIDGRILNGDNEGTWRRTVTMAAKQTDMERIEYVRLTKEFKALRKQNQKLADSLVKVSE